MHENEVLTIIDDCPTLIFKYEPINSHLEQLPHLPDLQHLPDVEEERGHQDQQDVAVLGVELQRQHLGRGGGGGEHCARIQIGPFIFVLNSLHLPGAKCQKGGWRLCELSGRNTSWGKWFYRCELRGLPW